MAKYVAPEEWFVRVFARTWKASEGLLTKKRAIYADEKTVSVHIPDRPSFHRTEQGMKFVVGTTGIIAFGGAMALYKMLFRLYSGTGKKK